MENKKTGNFITQEEYDLLDEKKKAQYKKSSLVFPEHIPFVPKRPAPNSPCLCGSGKKFKKCCSSKIY